MSSARRLVRSQVASFRKGQSGHHYQQMAGLQVTGIFGVPAQWKTPIIKSTIRVLDRLGLFRALEPAWQGVGAILTLHHVSPAVPAEFSPNRILSVTPSFLRAVIHSVRDMGYEIVSLDEACDRLEQGRFERRFVCFTLDDGYRDNLTHALPVFEAEQVPFTLYVSTGMPDGSAVLWWELLERVIADNDRASLPQASGPTMMSMVSTADKYRAFQRVYTFLRSLHFDDQQKELSQFFNDKGIDVAAHTREQSLQWPELKILAAHPLCVIGAHTVNHPALRLLGRESARREMMQSSQLLSRRLGKAIEHFAYPYGDAGSADVREFGLARELGFRTAVTTRKSVLFPEHARYLHALPRVSLNGDYQDDRLTRLFVKGGPFVISNRFRRLNVNPVAGISEKS